MKYTARFLAALVIAALTTGTSVVWAVDPAGDEFTPSTFYEEHFNQEELDHQF